MVLRPYSHPFHLYFGHSLLAMFPLFVVTALSQEIFAKRLQRWRHWMYAPVAMDLTQRHPDSRSEHAQLGCKAGQNRSSVVCRENCAGKIQT
jgi:hypothetical protein